MGSDDEKFYFDETDNIDAPQVNEKAGSSVPADKTSEGAPFYFDETGELDTGELKAAGAVPCDAVPGDTVRIDPVRTDTVPGDTVRIDRIPADAAPEEEKTAPEEDIADYDAPEEDVPEEPAPEDAEEDSEEDGEEQEETGFFHRIRNLSAMDYVVIGTGMLVAVLLCVFGVSWMGLKASRKTADTYAAIGTEFAGSAPIGQAKIEAVGAAISARQAAEAASAASAKAAAEAASAKAAEDSKTDVVELHLSSILKDLKIKFISHTSAAIITGVPFQVQVTDPSGATTVYTNDDQDGIIYRKDLKGGTYTVAMVPFGETDEDHKKYSISSQPQTVQVKDTIEYKKVDVADEIKTESQVNVAKEDTEKQNTVVESVNTDTVEWVESSKTEVDGSGDGTASQEDDYQEVSKDDIPDPAASASAFEEADVTLEGGEAAVQESADPSESGTASSDGSADSSDSSASSAENTDYSIVLKPDASSIAAGSTTKISASLQPSKDDVSYSWSSSLEPIAKVSSDGTVTGEAVGESEITCKATVDGKEITATVTIKVTEAGSSTGASAGSSEASSGSSSQGSSAGSSGGSSEGSSKASSGSSSSAALRDKDGNALYIKDDSGKYVPATAADYSTADTFYKLVTVTKTYKYTGWQTISGRRYYYDKDGNKVTGEQTIQGAKYKFGDDGSLAGGNKLGIDVSKWNENIDWTAVKNSGVDYAIIRCGFRGSSEGALVEDSRFRANMQGAKSVGIKTGVYFFSQAVNEVEAVEEASMVLDLLSGMGLTYPVFLDIEGSDGRADAIDTATRTAAARAFCKTISNSGYSAGIYSNKDWLSSRIATSSLSGYTIWLAQYAAAPTYTSTRYDMWQYTCKGSVAGISGDVDMNQSYMSY
jgi:GH25 family lysozyme M1 (1,4-beta-N-acetylmuramidase)